jgi:sugar lactone lactonase YvrE
MRPYLCRLRTLFHEPAARKFSLLFAFVQDKSSCPLTILTIVKDGSRFNPPPYHRIYQLQSRKVFSVDSRLSVLVDTLRFPEIPRWHDGALWCSDLFAGRIIRVDLDGQIQTVVQLSDTPTGLGWTSDEQLLIVSATARRLLRLQSNQLVEVADLSHLVSFPCNDMVVDVRGNAYIGNIGFDFGNLQAAPQPTPIIFVPVEGSARIAADGLMFPNGMVITPDGQTLIIAESYAARLTAFTIQPDGTLSDRRTWAQFESQAKSNEGQITPDGICLDAEGALWVASPGTKQVFRVREGAEITHRIPIDTIPLACMLGGKDGRTLFVPTTESQDPSDTSARGHIEIIHVDVPDAGAP